MVSLRGTGSNLRPTEPFSEWPWWVRKGVRDPSAEAGVTTEPWNRMEKKKETQGNSLREPGWRGEGVRESPGASLCQRKGPQIHYLNTSASGVSRAPAGQTGR